MFLTSLINLQELRLDTQKVSLGLLLTFIRNLLRRLWRKGIIQNIQLHFLQLMMALGELNLFFAAKESSNSNSSWIKLED